MHGDGFARAGALAVIFGARAPSARAVYPLVFLAGIAALSWEVLWQLEASLAIGISAKATALTFAVTMAGMSLGSVMMGRALRTRAVRRPMRIYGSLELVIGLIGGLLLLPGFRLVERIDGSIFAAHPVVRPHRHREYLVTENLEGMNLAIVRLAASGAGSAP